LLHREFPCVVSKYKCIVTAICLSSLIFFILGPFLILILAGLRFLYSFLCREYINHVQVLDFLLLSYPSPVWRLLSVTHVS
jgi:hypothetical protein